MALTKELLNLKSAGTYRIIVDKSQMPSAPEPLDNTRLVVGFSKKGPVNRPIYIVDSTQFKSIFGDIDRNLETRKSFFHRSCLVALEAGPIYALNLTKLDNTDYVDTIKFATSCTGVAQTANPQIDGEVEYSGMFNKDIFFVPDASAFLKNVDASQFIEKNTTNDILDFTNIGKEPVSVIVVKSSDYNTKNYQITAQEWYGKGDEPEFLNPNSLISDFMVDVYILRGNWGGDFSEVGDGAYSRFASDVKFAQYFDSAKGLKRKIKPTDTTDTSLVKFLNESDVKVIAQYTGCLIPDFTDKLGRDLYIKNLINNDTDITGILCAVNESIFTSDNLDGESYGIDLVGHSLYQQASDFVNFLSYSGDLKVEIPLDTVSQTGTPTPVSVAPVESQVSGRMKFSFSGDTMTISAFLYDGSGTQCVWDKTLYDSLADFAGITDWADFIAGTAPAEKLLGYAMSDSDVAATYSINSIEFSSDYGKIAAFLGDASISLTESEFNSIVTSGGSDFFGMVTISVKYSDMLKLDASGAFTYYDNITGTLKDNNGATYFFWGTEVFDKKNVLNPAAKIVDSSAPETVIDEINSFTVDYFEEGGVKYKAVKMVTENATSVAGQSYTLVLKNITSVNIQTEDVSSFMTLAENQFAISLDNEEAAEFVKPGNYVLGKFQDRLSRIVSITAISNNGIVVARLATCQEPIFLSDVSGVKSVTAYKKFTDSFEYYNIFTLNGFILKEHHMPNGTNQRQHEILDLLEKDSVDTNLYHALIDRENISFRYLIDSFGLGIEPNCKAQYSKLCAARMSAFPIINAPSASDFSNSADPYFCDSNKALSAEFIVKGGNPDYNNSFLFSLPDVTMRPEFGGWYYPYVKVGTGMATKTVPPAAYVSNKYIEKYGTEHPWTSVAGEKRGVLGSGVVGVETTLIQDNRDWLEPFGFNPIIYHKGSGVVIYGDQTGYQTPQSAISKISIMESIIYIQDNVERILRNYVFEANTAQTRLEIYTLVDTFMKGVKSLEGVYDYAVVMDQSNNTNEIIDHNMGIIDIAIEPVRKMEKLVQRLTILRTGVIEAGGFQVV